VGAAMRCAPSKPPSHAPSTTGTGRQSSAPTTTARGLPRRLDPLAEPGDR
jgi:hypothetical protein